jgi:NRAMP (natural resistance-associated macrophage protein)-like metal ion transporter
MTVTKKKSLYKRFLILLTLIGPGIITGSVDNDVGGITTYSIAGAQYGYALIWTLIPAFIILLVVQEMNARMGIITGKGLADLIRENFGVKITFFISLGLVISNIGNTTSEFAGVAGSMEILGMSRYISVPLAGILVWFLVVKGSYRSSEKIFLVFSVFLLTYVVSALIQKPNWNEIGQSIIKPEVQFNFGYISIVIGIIGTTIAPWMQFYMQSAVIEKGLTKEDYPYTMVDVVIGCVLTVGVAFFIVVACAASLHQNANTQVIHEAKDAALALKPVAGVFASQLFAFGLLIASIFAAAILPLATAYYICEAFGFEAGIDKKLKEAPEFYTFFTAIMVVSIFIILIPGAPLIPIILWTQIINGMLLPVVLISMMIIINKYEVMGNDRNGAIKNTIGWVTIIILILLTIVLTFEPILSLF